MIVVILNGHDLVRGRLRIMGVFNGDPSCSFCGMETETVQHITCCCEALVYQGYNIFGKPSFEPKDISTDSLKDLCLFIRDRVTESVLNESLGLHNKPQAEVLPEQKKNTSVQIYVLREKQGPTNQIPFVQ
jgi:hypothetical protein